MNYRRYLFLFFVLLLTFMSSTSVMVVSAEDNSDLESAVTIKSVLNGKTALFCGDSICAAAVHDKTTFPQTGWAGRIAFYYGMTVVNKGYDGASVSTCRDENRIIKQLNSVKDTPFDYIILHGGVNDAMDSALVGNMIESRELKDFDVTTFAGGLEELFYTAKQNYPDKTEIGYIMNFRTPLSEWGGRTKNMSEYFAVAKQICEKWDVEYLDLYNDDEFNTKDMKVTTTINLKDYLHPNTEGYDVLYKKIAPWMETLGVEPVESTQVIYESVSSVSNPKNSDNDNRTLWIIIGSGLFIVLFGVAYISYKSKVKKS